MGHFWSLRPLCFEASLYTDLKSHWKLAQWAEIKGLFIQSGNINQPLTLRSNERVCTIYNTIQSGSPSAKHRGLFSWLYRIDQNHTTHDQEGWYLLWGGKTSLTFWSIHICQLVVLHEGYPQSRNINLIQDQPIIEGCRRGGEGRGGEVRSWVLVVVSLKGLLEAAALCWVTFVPSTTLSILHPAHHLQPCCRKNNTAESSPNEDFS